MYLTGCCKEMTEIIYEVLGIVLAQNKDLI